LLDHCSNLDSAADKCGPSGCSDLTLQAQGNTYLTVVATSRDPSTSSPLKDPICIPANRSEPVFNATLNPADVMPKIASAQDVPTEQQVYWGSAYILSGPMTVRSKTREAKWQEGWFNLIVPLVIGEENPLPWNGPTAISELNSWFPPKVPFVDADDFWAYKLDFNSADKGGHGYAGDRA
jgi:hypothetical protein